MDDPPRYTPKRKRSSEKEEETSDEEEKAKTEDTILNTLSNLLPKTNVVLTAEKGLNVLFKEGIDVDGENFDRIFCLSRLWDALLDSDYFSEGDNVSPELTNCLKRLIGKTNVEFEEDFFLQLFVDHVRTMRSKGIARSNSRETYYLPAMLRAISCEHKMCFMEKREEAEAWMSDVLRGLSLETIMAPCAMFDMTTKIPKLSSSRDVSISRLKDRC